ncbi:MAG: alpha/beta family hydrolase [Chloroflexota bacterium]
MSRKKPQTHLPTIYLAHGASGNAASMTPHVDGLTKRGFAAQAVQLPVGLAEKAVERYRAQVPDLSEAVIGGQSYGGRVASLLAADDAPRAIVLLCFPLHRPGQPDGTTRVAHFPGIKCPVLFLSGEADPFARIDLLRAAVQGLANAQLITYPRLGHSLRPVLDDALDRVAEFVRGLPAD